MVNTGDQLIFLKSGADLAKGIQTSLSDVCVYVNKKYRNTTGSERGGSKYPAFPYFFDPSQIIQEELGEQYVKSLFDVCVGASMNTQKTIYLLDALLSYSRRPTKPNGPQISGIKAIGRLFIVTLPEVRLAERLHEFGLLPEYNRKKFVETVSNYALQGQDVGALYDEGIRSLFKDDEFEHLRERVRTELLPRLDGIRQERESNHRSDNSPEEHMQQLLESFEILKKCFGDDVSAARIIEQEILRANEWISENTPEEPKRNPRKLGRFEASDEPQSARSIFDDIDADEDS